MKKEIKDYISLRGGIEELEEGEKDAFRHLLREGRFDMLLFVHVRTMVLEYNRKYPEEMQEAKEALDQVTDPRKLGILLRKAFDIGKK